MHFLPWSFCVNTGSPLSRCTQSTLDQNPLSLKGQKCFEYKELVFGFFDWSVKTWPYFRKLLWRLELSVAKIPAASGRSQTGSHASPDPQEALGV